LWRSVPVGVEDVGVETVGEILGTPAEKLLIKTGIVN
jgi:hypothetical protein